jgi:hypothetical protein
MKKYLPGVFVSLGTIFTTSLFVLSGKNVIAAPATHIVISEVQVAGGVANDEFVELYNPTNSNIVLDGWRLRRIDSDDNIVATMSGTIPAHGYFLVAKAEYDGTVSPDLPYSATSTILTVNSTIGIYSDAGITLVDKLGMGTAVDYEISPALAPSPNGSVERKACGEDTDNNLNDFILREVSGPQNSQSAVQNCASSTPTASPTPSPTPTLTPTPTPTITPTMTPTMSPTPTNSPVATAKPIFMTCGMQFKTLDFGFFNLRLPFWKCF